MTAANRANSGRPPKPPITLAEREAVRGLSIRQARIKINQLRGATQADTVEEMRKRSVSTYWVRQQLRTCEEINRVRKSHYEANPPQDTPPVGNSATRDTQESERHMGDTP